MNTLLINNCQWDNWEDISGNPKFRPYFGLRPASHFGLPNLFRASHFGLPSREARNGNFLGNSEITVTVILFFHRCISSRLYVNTFYILSSSFLFPNKLFIQIDFYHDIFNICFSTLILNTITFLTWHF